MTYPIFAVMKIKWNKMRMWSDGALTKALKAGDMDAYEELFYRYYALIFRFVSRFVRNEALAEDVVQNIFMRLWLNRENLDENKSVKNFLYVSARNESFDILKSQKENMMSLRTVLGGESDFSDVNIEEDCNSAEMLGIVLRGISKLPPQRQLVFRMSRYEHLSNKEIADKLNLSVRTVEKHIQLAIKDLKQSVN